MPPSFPPETETFLKDTMLSIAQRDGFDKCFFDRDALASIVKNTELTEEQALEWARHARYRHDGGDEMEFFLRLAPLGDDEVSPV